jgi:hypothetical protein
VYPWWAAPRPITAAGLADRLWDDPPPSAIKTVQAHVSRARTALRAIADGDVRALVPRVTAPVLLLSRVECPSHDPGHGRWLAAHLPRATLREHPDPNGVWFLGDVDRVLTQFAAFARSVDREPSFLSVGGVVKVITFVIVSIMAIFVLAGVVTVVDGVRGKL